MGTEIDRRTGNGQGGSIHGWRAGIARLADPSVHQDGSSIGILHFLRDVWRRIHALVSRTSDHGESPSDVLFFFFFFHIFLGAEFKQLCMYVHSVHNE